MFVWCTVCVQAELTQADFQRYSETRAHDPNNVHVSVYACAHGHDDCVFINILDLVRTRENQSPKSLTSDTSQTRQRCIPLKLHFLINTNLHEFRT